MKLLRQKADGAGAPGIGGDFLQLLQRLVGHTVSVPEVVATRAATMASQVELPQPERQLSRSTEPYTRSKSGRTSKGPLVYSQLSALLLILPNSLTATCEASVNRTASFYILLLQACKSLAELGHLGCGHGHAVALVGVARKKVLVVVLGCGVILEGQHLGHHRATVVATPGQLGQ